MTSFKGNTDDRGSQPELDRYRLSTLAVFVRSGDYWTIGFADINFTLKDIKGFERVAISGGSECGPASHWPRGAPMAKKPVSDHALDSEYRLTVPAKRRRKGA